MQKAEVKSDTCASQPASELNHALTDLVAGSGQQVLHPPGDRPSLLRLMKRAALILAEEFPTRPPKARPARRMAETFRSQKPGHCPHHVGPMAIIGGMPPNRASTRQARMRRSAD